MVTRALDVVYNPAFIKCIMEKFSLPHDKDHFHVPTRFHQAAREKYEMIKEQTKEEMFKNLQDIIQGKEVGGIV